MKKSSLKATFGPFILFDFCFLNENSENEVQSASQGTNGPEKRRFVGFPLCVQISFGRKSPRLQGPASGRGQEAPEKLPLRARVMSSAEPRWMLASHQV